jgi:hypothetical protein
MNDFNTWYKINKNVLKHLYYELINISKDNDIIIINNNKTYNNFLKMMYYESSKKVINKIEFPEYFYNRYNSKGYEKYKILNIN